MYLNHIGPPLRPQGPVLIIVKMDVPRPGPLKVRFYSPPLFFITISLSKTSLEREKTQARPECIGKVLRVPPRPCNIDT